MSTLIAVENIEHSFNDHILFQNLTFGIQQGQRVALIGINGAGKSTLLKLMSEVFPPTKGKVVKNKDAKIGYLNQDPQFNENDSISDFIFSLDNEQLQLIKKYEELSEQEHPNEDEMQTLFDELSTHNAWEYEYQIKTILNRMGIFGLHQKINTLSGGQKKRLSLAKLLIDNPDVYLLDEPTNHLDIDTIEWLEKILTTGGKTVLMVTHDRYFLDNVCNEIIELNRSEIYPYKGNYAYYLEKKAEREAIEGSTLAKNKNLLKKELEWMRRMPQARATKSKARIDAFYDLEAKTKNTNNKESVALEMKMSRQGNKILELHAVTKSFENKNIITDFNYVFKKGDRIGLAGQNGTGKSTLLNLITENIKPDTGEVIKGERTVFGYYQQKGLAFNPNDRVLDIVKEVAEQITMADGKSITASQLLTRFLFPPQKQHGMVSKLSGGEKKRLHLMKVLMLNPNFLILDEPTNDLDIDTLNVLEDFLLQYGGVLMLVSHDRYLLDRMSEQLFILEGDGYVTTYNGNYASYRLEKEEEKAFLKQQEIKQKAAKEASPQKAKLSYAEQKEIETLKEEIETLEKSVQTQEHNLAEEDSSNYEKIMDLSKTLQTTKDQVEEKTLRWLELEEKGN